MSFTCWRMKIGKGTHFPLGDTTVSLWQPYSVCCALYSPSYRGRSSVVGFLKIGYKKLFLLVSQMISVLFLFLSVFAFLLSSLIFLSVVLICPGWPCLFFLCLGPSGCPHWGRATLCFGFLRSREPTATWLWTGAVWLHVAGEAFLFHHLFAAIKHKIEFFSVPFLALWYPFNFLTHFPLCVQNCTRGLLM